jgi:hypothetical protein
MTPAEAVHAIREELDWVDRALLVHLDGPPDLVDAVLSSLDRPDRLVVHAGEQDIPRLKALNPARDLLFRQHRLLLFVTETGDDNRRLRRYATDLTSAFDLSLFLDRPRAPWREHLDALRADVQRADVLDLRGLIPAGPDVRLPLGEVFLRSVFRDPAPTDGPEPPSKPVLLLGGPGEGKSTALRFLAGAVARGERHPWTDGAEFGVYLPLAGFGARNDDRTTTLAEYVDSVLSERAGAPVTLGDGVGVALLFDGLDELRSDRLRRQVLDQAPTLASRVVVAGRGHVVDALRDADLATWGLAWLQPPSPEDALRLWTAVLRARDPAGPNDAAEALFARVAAHPDLAPLLATPLLLTLLVAWVDPHGELPGQRVLLYQALTDALVGSWRRLRTPTADAPALPHRDVARTLDRLGWWLVERGGGGASEADLLAFLAALEAEREPDPARAAAAARSRLDALRDDTALVAAGGLWRFVHPTFAEYFAARSALAHRPHRDALLADPYVPNFQQVVAFTLALAVDVEARPDVARSLVDALLTRSRRRARFDSRFAAGLSLALRETRSLAHDDAVALYDRLFELTFAYRHPPTIAAESQRAAMQALWSGAHVAALRQVLQSWFVAGEHVVPWGEVARAASAHSVRTIDPQADASGLPFLLGHLSLDAVPLLRRLLASDEPEVRALFWIPWSHTRPISFERILLARNRDPDAVVGLWIIRNAPENTPDHDRVVPSPDSAVGPDYRPEN